MDKDNKTSSSTPSNLLSGLVPAGTALPAFQPEPLALCLLQQWF